MPSRPTRALMAVAALAAALATSCAGTPSATVSVSATNPPTATPQPTRASMDPELEALLPDRVGTLDISKRSLTGLEFSSSADLAFGQFLQDIGVSGAAVSVASGFGASTAAPPSSVLVLAIRVRGATQEQIVSTFRHALEASIDRPYSVTAQTVSGKEVLVAVAQGVDDPPTYFYARDDVMFLASASDDALAAEAISLLP